VSDCPGPGRAANSTPSRFVEPTLMQQRNVLARMIGGTSRRKRPSESGPEHSAPVYALGVTEDSQREHHTDPSADAWYSLSFWPSHAQVLVHDAHVDFTESSVPFWTLPEEREARLSVRPTAVSVGMFDDGHVRITLAVHTIQPEVPDEPWDVIVETPLSIRSGTLGVSGILDEEPSLIVPVPAGRLRLRFAGRYRGEQNDFMIQAWPSCD